MPLDYDELRRDLERRRAARRRPATGARPSSEEEPPPPPRRPAAPPRAPVEAIALVITALFVLAGVGIFLLGKRVESLEHLPYRLGIALGFGGAALYAAGLVRVTRKWGEPPTTAGFLGRLAVIALAAVGCSFGAIGALVLLNVQLDTGSPTVHRALVVDKSLTSTKNGRHTAVRAASWWAGDVTLDFKLSESLYDRIEPRRTNLLVRTRPGAFGWKWVDGAPDVEDAAAVATAPAPAGPSGPTISEWDRAEARELFDRGTQQLREGARGQGVANLKRAIELDPTFLLAYRSLEAVLLPARDYDTMIDYWTTLVELQPDNATAWHGRARARAAKQDLEGAFADAEQACRLGRACDMVDRLRAETGR